MKSEAAAQARMPGGHDADQRHRRDERLGKQHPHRRLAEGEQRGKPRGGAPERGAGAQRDQFGASAPVHRHPRQQYRGNGSGQIQHGGHKARRERKDADLRLGRGRAREQQRAEVRLERRPEPRRMVSQPVAEHLGEALARRSGKRQAAAAQVPQARPDQHRVPGGERSDRAVHTEPQPRAPARSAPTGWRPGAMASPRRGARSAAARPVAR